MLRFLLLILVPTVLGMFGYVRKQREQMVNNTLAAWYKPDYKLGNTPTVTMGQVAAKRMYCVLTLQMMSAILNYAMPETYNANAMTRRDRWIASEQVTGHEELEINGNTYTLSELINVKLLQQVKQTTNLTISTFERFRLTRMRQLRDMEIQTLFNKLQMYGMNWNMSFKTVPLSRWACGNQGEITTGNMLVCKGQPWNPDQKWSFEGFVLNGSQNGSFGLGAADAVSGLNAVFGDAPFNLSIIRKEVLTTLPRILRQTANSNNLATMKSVLEYEGARTYHMKSFMYGDQMKHKNGNELQDHLDKTAFSRLCMEFPTTLFDEDGTLDGRKFNPYALLSNKSDAELDAMFPKPGTGSLILAAAVNKTEADEEPLDMKVIVARRFTRKQLMLQQEYEDARRREASSLRLMARHVEDMRMDVIGLKKKAAAAIESAPNGDADEENQRLQIANEEAITKATGKYADTSAKVAAKVLSKASKKAHGGHVPALQLARSTMEAAAELKKANASAACALQAKQGNKSRSQQSRVCQAVLAEVSEHQNKQFLLVLPKIDAVTGKMDSDMTHGSMNFVGGQTNLEEDLDMIDALEAQDQAMEALQLNLERLQGAVGPEMMYEADKSVAAKKYEIIIIIMCVAIVLLGVAIAAAVLVLRRSKKADLVSEGVESADYVRVSKNVMPTSGISYGTTHSQKDYDYGTTHSQKDYDFYTGSHDIV